MRRSQAFEEQLWKFISEVKDEMDKLESDMNSIENRKIALSEKLHTKEQELRDYLKNLTS